MKSPFSDLIQEQKETAITKVITGQLEAGLYSKEAVEQTLKDLEEREIDWENGMKPTELTDALVREVEKEGKVFLEVRSRWVGPFIHHSLVYHTGEE